MCGLKRPERPPDGQAEDPGAHYIRNGGDGIRGLRQVAVTSFPIAGPRVQPGGRRAPTPRKTRV